MKIRTWMIESFVVACTLAVVAVIKGGWLEWVGAVAVLLSFMHAQIADRHSGVAARQVREGSGAAVECWHWSTRYFVSKEVVWAVYFVAHQSWSALVGSALFLIYPIWRRWYARRWTDKFSKKTFTEMPTGADVQTDDHARGWEAAAHWHKVSLADRAELTRLRAELDKKSGVIAEAMMFIREIVATTKEWRIETESTRGLLAEARGELRKLAVDLREQDNRYTVLSRSLVRSKLEVSAKGRAIEILQGQRDEALAALAGMQEELGRLRNEALRTNMERSES